MPTSVQDPAFSFGRGGGGAPRPRLPHRTRHPSAVPPWHCPLLTILLVGLAAAQTPPVDPLRDLTPPQVLDSNPTEGVELGGRLVFVADAPEPTVFVTDGTANGTVRVAPAGPGPVTRLARAGSRVVFGSGDELWATDGTASGTGFVAAVAVAAFPDRGHGGREIVFAGRVQGDDELWRTDGTAFGTSLLADLDANGSSEPRHLTAYAWRTGLQTRHVTFFSATTSRTGRELWMTEGTPGTTQLVDDLVPGAGSSLFLLPTPASIAVYGTATDLYVAANNRTPAAGAEVFRWHRNTSSTGFTRLPLVEIAVGADSAETAWLTTRGDEVVLAAENAARGRELWRMGFASGAVALIDVVTGPGSSSPTLLSPIPSPSSHPLPAILFMAVEATPGGQLWSYDGGPPQRLSDGLAFPRFLAVTDGVVWFVAQTNTLGQELWRTEGTLASTRLAADLRPGFDSSAPASCGVLTVAGAQRLLFSAQPGGLTGRELHAAAGTSGPGLLVDLTPPRAVSSNPGAFVTLADRRAVFWTLVDFRPALWVLDAASSEVTLLWQAAVPGPALWGRPIALEDGTFLFGLATPLTSFPLLQLAIWRSDGTTSGTTLASLVFTSAVAYPRGDFVEFGDSIYFAFNEQQVFRTDRRGQGLVSVYGSPLSPPGTVRELTCVGDRLYFAGIPTARNDGIELHVWQPPAAPTAIDIASGPLGSEPRRLTPFRNRCYFVADDGVHGDELWRSNGTGNGTTMVVDANPGAGNGVLVQPAPSTSLVASGALFYVGTDGVHGWEPWRSTGFAEGTAMIADLHANGDSDPRDITAIHVGVVALSADDGVHGRELWRVDTLGNRQLFDLRPGALGSAPADLLWTTRHLLFSADDGVHGREPWHASWIDLTPVAMLADLAPGANGSNPDLLQQAGTRVLMAADPMDGVTGREAYAIDGDAASIALGRSCHPPDRIMQLGSTAPVLGRGLTYWVFDPGAGVLALARLSTPGWWQMPYMPCPAWLDPVLMISVGDFVTTGSFTRTIPLPAFGSLRGLHLRLQCFFYYPPSLLATNALDLLFGN